MENECEALPGVAYPGVQDNRSTLNTKTGYDDDESDQPLSVCPLVTMIWFCKCVSLCVTCNIAPFTAEQTGLTKLYSPVATQLLLLLALLSCA